MSKLPLYCFLAGTGLLAGCGNASDHFGIIASGDSSIANGRIMLKDGDVTLHADGAPDAVIGAAGDFSIDGKSIALQLAEREQFKHYYDGVLAVREHGIATGKAGVEIAGTAIADAFKGILSGNTDQIDRQVDAKSQEVQEAALKICDDISSIKTMQDRLAVELPAFKPYAGIIRPDAGEDCRKDSVAARSTTARKSSED